MSGNKFHSFFILYCKKIKTAWISRWVYSGAGDRNRTCTPGEPDSKSGASASSATPACFYAYYRRAPQYAIEIILINKKNVKNKNHTFKNILI